MGRPSRAHRSYRTACEDDDVYWRRVAYAKPPSDEQSNAALAGSWWRALRDFVVREGLTERLVLRGRGSRIAAGAGTVGVADPGAMLDNLTNCRAVINLTVPLRGQPSVPLTLLARSTFLGG